MKKIALYLLIALAIYSTYTLAVEQKDAKQLLKHTITFKADSFPFQQLDQWIHGKQLVLLGDATHGSQEFYRYRAEISRYLIENHGFSAVIIEGNWPAGQRVNQYIKHVAGTSAKQALSGFKKHFPWLWRNKTTEEFVQWLHGNNTDKQQAFSFYGMDLFSLTSSIIHNTKLLNQYEMPLSSQLIDLYQCFSNFKHDALSYGQQAIKDPRLSCQTQAEQQFNLISQHPDLLNSKAESFNLYINSFMIKAAEQYFRMTFEAKAEDSWNMRERAMLTIINMIIQQQKTNNQSAKVIIWAHNSHVGDARATGMKQQNRESLGQLLRQQFGAQQVFLMGALSYQGTLIASKQWGGSASLMSMPPAMEGSYSHLFHQLGLARFIMALSSLSFQSFNQRFIGVVYDQKEEQLYHYNSAQLDQQFDAILFIDKTTAVQPLDKY